MGILNENAILTDTATVVIQAKGGDAGCRHFSTKSVHVYRICIGTDFKSQTDTHIYIYVYFLKKAAASTAAVTTEITNAHHHALMIYLWRRKTLIRLHFAVTNRVDNGPVSISTSQ